MKRLLFLLILLTVVFGALFFWWITNTRPVSNEQALRDFVIPRGASAASIGERLQTAGFIRSAFAFKFLVQLTGKSQGIIAGEHQFSPDMSLTRIIEELTKEPKSVWVTIPEGLRREEIAAKVALSFVRKEDQKEFVQEFLSLTKTEEGFLFPDTYLFLRTSSPSQVVSVLKRTFDSRVDDKLRQNSQKTNISLKGIITLASIIERETRTQEERTVVAGILLNRLRIGMLLQADATVQYAKGQIKCRVEDFGCIWWEPVLREDLVINSPYNTYKFPGLPPGPIANPGLSSIKAAIFPEDSDYLYYLHDPDGQAYYARTLEEHNENIRKYLK